MSPRLRKLTLTAHVTFSVGWLGAALAYLALAIAALQSPDAQVVRAACISLEPIGWYAIVPLAFAGLATGLVQSLGTEWGLFRHYWIAAKFVLTVVAVLILVTHMRTAVSPLAARAAESAFVAADFGPQRGQLVVHAAGGIVVLLANTVLSIWKPWGLTPYGRRKQQERRGAPKVEVPVAAAATLPWAKIVGVHVVIVLVLVFVALHLRSGGFHAH